MGDQQKEEMDFVIDKEYSSKILKRILDAEDGKIVLISGRDNQRYISCWIT